MNVSGSFTHDSQKPEQNVQYISMRHTDVCPYNETLLGNKEGYIINISNMDESQKHAEWKPPDHKERIL